MRKQISRFLYLGFFIVLTGGEWSSHLVELDGFESKMNSHETKIRELAHELHLIKDKRVAQSVTEEIAENHKQYVKTAARADKLRHHLRFEHPEKGLDFDAKYKRSGKERVSELEQELGLDGILSRVVNDVQKKFPKEPAGETCKGEMCIKKGSHDPKSK